MLFLESCSTVRSTWLAPRPRSAIRLKLTYGTGSDILYINPMFTNPLVSCMYPLPLYEEEFLAGTHVILIANIQKVWEIVRLNNFVKLFCPFCGETCTQPRWICNGAPGGAIVCRRNCVCTWSSRGKLFQEQFMNKTNSRNIFRFFVRVNKSWTILAISRIVFRIVFYTIAPRPYL